MNVMFIRLNNDKYINLNKVISISPLNNKRCLFVTEDGSREICHEHIDNVMLMLRQTLSAKPVVKQYENIEMFCI
jgi:hypothetical protein